MIISDEKRQAIKTNLQTNTVTLPDGTSVSAIGQGTWYMGEKAEDKQKEIEGLQFGLDLGLNLIDTAEMYADGGAETIVGEAISGRRDDCFLVSKVYPHNASLKKIEKACDQSLKRLKTDSIDLYLLHWRGSVPLQETIEGMERLIDKGKIKRWGVSNFDTDDMKELFTKTSGRNCMTNQVLYHLGSRGIEYDLLPWQIENEMPIMAYSPLAQGGSLRKELLNNSGVKRIAQKYGVEPLQIALAWTIRSKHVISIPKAVQKQHILLNAEAASIPLSTDDLRALDTIFPKPTKKQPLDII